MIDLSEYILTYLAILTTAENFKSNSATKDLKLTEATIRSVLEKSCSLKSFCNIRKKISVLKSVFNKVQAEGLQLYWKETPRQVFSCEYCEIFKSAYFEKYLRMAVSLVLKLKTSGLFNLDMTTDLLVNVFLHFVVNIAKFLRTSLL